MLAHVSVIPALLAQSDSERLVDLLFHTSAGGWLMFGGMVVLLVAIKTTGSTIRAVARERTRREIAAFIAEGSMSPEQGERLMKSGTNDRA